MNLYDINIKLIDSFERIGKAWIGPILTVFVGHPDDAQIVLSSKDCVDRPYFYRFLPDGVSLVNANGTVQRKVNNE